MTGSMSMTERRQALHAGKQAATSFFLVLILTFLFASPSVLAKPDAAFAGAAKVIEAAYEWPFQSHASMGPACAVVEIKGDNATLWTGSQTKELL